MIIKTFHVKFSLPPFPITVNMYLPHKQTSHEWTIMGQTHQNNPQNTPVSMFILMRLSHSLFFDMIISPIYFSVNGFIDLISHFFTFFSRFFSLLMIIFLIFTTLRWKQAAAYAAALKRECYISSISPPPAGPFPPPLVTITSWLSNKITSISGATYFFISLTSFLFYLHWYIARVL